MVVGTFPSPLDAPRNSSLPVLHSATSKSRESRQLGTNETHAVGLNNSVDDDGIPKTNAR